LLAYVLFIFLVRGRTRTIAEPGWLEEELEQQRDLEEQQGEGEGEGEGEERDEE
jgi:hypothetical protein